MLGANFEDCVLINFDNVASVVKDVMYKEGITSEWKIRINEVGREEPTILEFDTEESFLETWRLVKVCFGLV